VHAGGDDRSPLSGLSGFNKFTYLQRDVTLFPFLAVSTPAFWNILVPLFPFPLFHVLHFQRPRRDASAVYDMALRLFVCLSVRLSVHLTQV